MSAAAQSSPVVQGGPGMKTRAAAVSVVVALGALAGYAVFSGPTRVSVSVPVKLAPSVNKPAPPVQTEPEGQGGGND